MKSIARHFWLFAVAAVFGIWQGHSSFLSHPADLASGPEDGLHNAWILLWNHHALTTPGLAIWDAPNFFPTPNTLAFSENLFGLLWISAPIQQATGNPILAANVILFVAFLLNAHATYVLCRTLGASHLPSLTGALLLAFAPYHWSHLQHLQLQSLYPGIYAWNFTLRFLQGGRPVTLLLAAAFFVWTYYCSIYLGVIFGVGLGIFVVTYLIFAPGAASLLRRPGIWGVGLLAALCTGLLVWPVSAPYLRVAHDWGAARTLGEASQYSCEPATMLLPPYLSRENHRWLISLLPRQVRGGESGVFPGLFPCLLLVVGILAAFRRQTLEAENRALLRSVLLTGAMLAILMLGPVLIWNDKETEISLPFALLHRLPGVSAIRVPTRFVMPLLVCLAMISSIVLTRMERSVRAPWHGWALSAGAILLLAIDYRILPDAGFPARPLLVRNALDEYLLRQPEKSAVLYWPAPIHSLRIQRHQFEQAKHWRPLVNGFSGFFPATFLALNERLEGRRDDYWSETLRNSPATVFVVDHSALGDDLSRTELKARIADAGFASEGIMAGREVFRRIGPIPVPAPALEITSVDLITGPEVRGQRALARMRLNAGQVWFAASGTIRRGEVRGRTSWPMQLQVPALLTGGETATGEFNTTLPLSVVLGEKAPLRSLVIDGVTWGESVPVHQIAAADSSANPARRGELLAELKLKSPDLGSPLAAGHPVRFVIQVTNTGPTVWLDYSAAMAFGSERGEVDAIVTWRALDPALATQPAGGNPVLTHSIPLRHPLRSSESTELSASVATPTTPGRYLVRVDLVAQYVAWFSEVGPTVRLEQEVSVE